MMLQFSARSLRNKRCQGLFWRLAPKTGRVATAGPWSTGSTTVRLSSAASAQAEAVEPPQSPPAQAAQVGEPSTAQAWQHIHIFLDTAKAKRKAHALINYQKKMFYTRERFPLWKMMGYPSPPKNELFKRDLDKFSPFEEDEEKLREQFREMNAEEVGKRRAKGEEVEDEENIMDLEDTLDLKAEEPPEGSELKAVDWTQLQKYGPVSTRGLDDENKKRLAERLRQEEIRFYTTNLWALGVILRHLGARPPPSFDIEVVARDPFLFTYLREKHYQQWKLFKYHAARSKLYVRRQDEINAAFVEMNNFQLTKHTRAKE
eukprot:gb/GEZN01011014.1/.p1 GENE.gb/GEZN01011014.1/~~gb/GEZN01011014.1/.p1  ORF type:complete len:317 (-),score=53.71 gb/GEZN01011014.1/:139-1089(-)